MKEADIIRQLSEIQLQLHELQNAEKDEPEEQEESPEDKGMAIVAMMHAAATALEPLKAAIERDAQQDAQIGQRLESLQKSMDTMTQELAANRQTNERLVAVLEVLASPEVREGVVELPTGPVRMTVTAQRKRRATQ